MVIVDFGIVVLAMAATRRDQAMLRQITDMPAGMIGFEAIGEVEDDDWEEIAVYEALLTMRILSNLPHRLLTMQATHPNEGRV